jgi:head-tail adaptor
MISRKYDKYIEIWKTTTVPDGYGGNVVTDELDYSIWANVTAKTSNRLNENGQNDNFVQTTFTVRNRVNIQLSIKDNFIKYNDIIYNIDSILNIDLDNIDIQIQATQRGNFTNAINPSV